MSDTFVRHLLYINRICRQSRVRLWLQCDDLLDLTYMYIEKG